MVSFNLRAETFTWNGGATGAFEDPGNWLCGEDVAKVIPGEADTVDFSGTSATITFATQLGVKALVGPGAGNQIVLQRSEDVKSVKFYVLGSPTVPGGTLVIDGLTFYASNTLGSNQYSCNPGYKMLLSDGGCVKLINEGVVFVGTTNSDSPACRIEIGSGSTYWTRYYDAAGIAGLSMVIDDGVFDGFNDNSQFKSVGDVTVTFKGTKPAFKAYCATPSVSGVFTLRYVLPASPYPSQKGPMQSEGAKQQNFDPPAGSTVKIEIDPSSPGLTSGAVQTYRLIKWDKNAGYGVVNDNFQLCDLRTSTESFAWLRKAGEPETVPPQYLDVTIDGTYDPSNADMEAVFNEPDSLRPDMVFTGAVNVMGARSGEDATKATLKLDYGLTDALGTSVELGEVTSTGAFSFNYDGFDETSTYFYRLTLENDIGQTIVGEIGTCSHVCGTKLEPSVSATMEDGCGTVSGSVRVIGAGTTTVKLLMGFNPVELVESASVEVNARGAFTIDVTYPGEGKVYYKLVSSNSFGEQGWTSETDVGNVVVSDSNTYEWKGEDGQVNDPAKWTRTTGTGGIGYPTSQSTVVFPGGITSVVTVVESVDYAHVTFMQDDSDYTFVGDNKQFGVLDATCGGKNARLRLEGVKLNDPGYIWSGKAVFSCGDNCRIDLANGAQMVYRHFHLTGSNTVWTIGDGARCEVASGGLEGDGSELIVSNGYLYVGNPIRFDGRKITVLGEAPTLSITRMTCAGAAFDIELPETPYAAAPIVSGADMGNFANDKMTTINILKSPAARRKGGTYRILKWGLVSDSSKNAYGINTNNVVITGLRSGDSYTWSWEPGEEYESLGPQYLDIHYAKGGGLLLLVR